MARNPRRRAKFRPFRMTERFQKAVLVALCVFIMVIFAVPTGTCLGRKRGGRDPQATALSIGGRAVTFGEIDEVRSRWTFIYGPALQYMFGGRRESEFLTDAEAIDILTRAHEAERLGVHVSKAQVNDTIRNELFPRRVTVEYLFAKHSDFDGDAKASEAAVAKARAEIVALFGSPLRGAFERIGSDSSRKLSRGESRPFTARTSLDALAQIADVPDIARRAFADPIGQVSEVVALADRVCLFRVTTRGVGFGPDGLYYPERQSWVGEGYGVAETKPYVDLLREHRVIQAQLEQTVRESIAYDRIYQLYTNSVAGPPGGPYEPADGSALPLATVRDRYRRDNTRAVTAYFSLNAADFARGVSTTDDELRAFYDQHKNTARDEGRVGYLQAEQVTIQYVLGRKRDIEQALSERELRDYYRNNRDEFKDPYEKALPQVRTRVAELRLRRLVGETVARAAERANQGQDPNLPALAAEASRQTAGAFACKTPPPFSARDAEKVVPALREGKLADALFGDNGKQYLLAGEERKPGESRKFISTAFECADGRYFFRVLRREASAEVPYERIAAATREQLVQDITDHKAADAAQEKAREYRTGICQAAFDAFAKAVGTKPIETGYLLADTAIAPIGKTVPKLYDELAVAPVGQVGSLVAEGDHLLLARLIEREDTKGIKLQLIALKKEQAPKDLVPPPALYQQQARYDDDPYQHLDKPTPMAFDKVKADIQKLLTRRRTVDLATERLAVALAEVADAKDAKLADVAKKHKLQHGAGVKVALAKPQATAQVGVAAGFGDALAALKPGEVSKALSSTKGRFAFRLTARDEKTATLDLVSVLYDAVAPEAKVDDKAVRQYYDDHRDTAYVTGDEIKDAPKWDDLPKPAKDRVAKDLRDGWAKKSAVERLEGLRTSLLLDAFRTYPPDHPLKSSRPIRLTVQDTGAFKPAAAPPLFKEQPALLKALGNLEVGQVSPPLETRTGSLLALVRERKDDGTLQVSTVALQSWEWDQPADGDEPSDEELKKYYEAHQPTFRVDDELQIEYLGVRYDDLVKTLKVADAEVKKEYDRGIRERDATYRDHTKLPDFVPLPFEKVQGVARRQVANRKARAEAERLLAAAQKALKVKDAPQDFKALVAGQSALVTGLSSFFTQKRRTLQPVGLAPELVANSFAAKDGELIGPVFGLDGACLARRHDVRAAHVPPFAEIRSAVLADYRRGQANREAMAAAAALRKRIAPAVAKAADKADAFKKAVEAEPLQVTVPKAVRVAVTRPFYPLGATMARMNMGVAREPEFVHAVFALRPAQLSEVVLTRDRATCHVAMPTRFLTPGKAAPFQLAMTRRTIAQATLGMLRAGWRAYLEQSISTDR